MENCLALSPGGPPVFSCDFLVFGSPSGEGAPDMILHNVTAWIAYLHAIIATLTLYFTSTMPGFLFCSPASAVAAGKLAAAQEGVQFHNRFLLDSVKAKRIVWYTPATAGKAWHGERAQRQGGIDEAKDAISEDKRVQAQVSISRIRALRSADSQTGGVT